MAKNDIILVDGLVDQRLSQKIPSDQRDEVFEYLVISEFLKDYDLSADEIDSGWIDGAGDGGIDGFYVFINGHLLEDPATFLWPRTNASIDVFLLTSKHHATFQQATLDALIATIEELFDFSIEDSDLKGSYSEELLTLRGFLLLAYRRLSIGRPTVQFTVVYGSRGDSTKVGESVAARARQIEHTLASLFSSSVVRFIFLGAAELVDCHRRSRTFSLDLPFIEHLATGKESYVLLVKLSDYYKFVSDEVGNLRRYLFDSNVRDYLGVNTVNQDIAQSLADTDAPDFWWLNNGVTILATNATVPGKTILLQDIQIVNGLQTTETVFKHFQASNISSERCLLVKIIVTTDSAARDRIIRATNNQSPVEVAALHATDKIQRDIEDILERYNWYYERRRNYYKNIGKPSTRFVTPAYLASAVVALIFKNVPKATRLRTRFMRDPVAYDNVFSSTFPLEAWVALVSIFKRTDDVLATLVQRERTINNLRPLVSFLAVSRALKTYAFGPHDLIAPTMPNITDAEIRDAYLASCDPKFGVSLTGRVKASAVFACCIEWSLRYSVGQIEVVGKREIVPTPENHDKGEKPELSPELITKINDALPPQPWKPGVHGQIATKLGVSRPQVSAAINDLIARGVRNRQRNGVVFDSDGNIIAVDAARASAFGETGRTESNQENAGD